MTNEERQEKLNRIEELKKGIILAEQNYNYYKAMQLAFKLIINGSYGAFANPHFVMSNANISNSITYYGRDVILYMLEKIQTYFYRDWHKDTRAHNLISYSYIVKENRENGKYFMMQNDNVINDRGFADEVLESGVKTSGLHNLLEYWKVCKPNLKDEDGRLVVIDNTEYIILYRRDLHEFDGVVPIDGTRMAIRDESRYGVPDENGVFYEHFRKEDVVIYGDTDSLYVTFAPVMKSCNFKGDPLEFILTFDRFIEEPMHKEALTNYTKPYGVKNLHDFELETVNKSALHMKKKKYLNNVVWEDGIFYEDMEHFYPKGIDIVRSSTPPFVRGKKQKGGVWEFIDYLFKNTGEINIKKILKIMKDLKKQFIMAGSINIDNIAMNCSINKYSEKVISDTNRMEVVKGSHYSVKACMFHNYLLNKHPEFKTMYDYVKSNKIKWYHCKSKYEILNGEKYEPANRIAYLRSYHPAEIMEKEGVEIDWDMMFEKSMLKIVNEFLEPIGLPKINKRLSVLNSLFGGNFIAKSKKLKAEEETFGEIEVKDPTTFNKDVGDDDDKFDDFEEVDSFSDFDSFDDLRETETTDDFDFDFDF